MILSPDAMNSMLVATIDSDIANIPENEFTTVFTGGIVVMFGGLLSALVVGFIVEKRNLYANIVADSYAQGGGDDEEFWKGLSEEEKKKTQELLQRLKESKSGGARQNGEGTEPMKVASVESKQQVTSPNAAAVEPEKSTPIEGKKIGMFSDYGED